MATTEEMTQRLARLRSELGRRRLHGFIVPRADEHQNEFVPPNAERLAWLTGFTGSAGAAVVLPEKAAIFVDGRYTLQVRREVDVSLFTPLHLIETPPHDWLARELSEGQRLGFDPRLHTMDGAARLEKACRLARAELVACDDNPLDAVWEDRPAPPDAPVEPYGTERAGRSSAAKRADIAAALREQRQDAAVLISPDSVAWLLNMRGGDVPYTPLPLCTAIIHADAGVDLFLDPAKSGKALEDHLGGEVRLHSPDAFGPMLEALGRRKARVRVDPAVTSHWVAERLRQAGATLERAQDPCALPKARKTPEELEGARRAHRRDGAALCRFLAWLAREAPGGAVTEARAAEMLAGLRAENELFRGLSFPTISAAGPNGAVVHYRTTPETDRALAPGTLYLVDSGAQYLDGTTDVTRTVAVGAPSEEARRAFTLVLKGHIALATARFPKGTTGSQLDVLARQFLWRHGLDYDHGTGHGVGSYLGVHEGPQRISKAPSAVALEAGMILSNEPGYYREGAFGIRIENLVAVMADRGAGGSEREMLGFETLTLAPIDRALVDRALLTEEEAGWLNAYHRRVRDEIGPLLDGEAAAWLDEATRPV